MTFRNKVEPFYFGEAPQRLYGCHHFPQVSRGRAFGVVLCSPIGQEYLKSHRVIYQLAVLLSKIGFHVLRFDYFGCGDSEGNFEEGSMVRWKEDILTAVDQMQHRSEIEKVCLIGLRIGATLALQTALDCFQIIGLVLWEPLFNGKAYVSQLENLHQEFISELRYQELPLTNRSETGMIDEVLGYPMTSALREELLTIEVDHARIRPGVKLLALVNSEESSKVSYLTHFAAMYPQTEAKMIAEKIVLWREFNKRLFPVQSLNFIVEWVDSVRI
jgi:uncharacterized protein